MTHSTNKRVKIVDFKNPGLLWFFCLTDVMTFWLKSVTPRHTKKHQVSQREKNKSFHQTAQNFAEIIYSLEQPMTLVVGAIWKKTFFIIVNLSVVKSSGFHEIAITYP